MQTQTIATTVGATAAAGALAVALFSGLSIAEGRVLL
jgi:hypothetical protein